jgi:adenosylcobyric acid synthase
MLGEALIDTHGIDGNAPGLGLLPLVTQFAANKTVRRTTRCFVRHMPQIDPLSSASDRTQPHANPWSALAGVRVSGYEIHHGQTVQHPAMAQAGDKAVAVLPEGLGWSNAAGNVLGVYLHGLFEDPAAYKRCWVTTWTVRCPHWIPCSSAWRILSRLILIKTCFKRLLNKHCLLLI